MLADKTKYPLNKSRFPFASEFGPALDGRLYLGLKSRMVSFSSVVTTIQPAVGFCCFELQKHRFDSKTVP